MESKVREFEETTTKYLENARRFLDLGEYQKSSEFLWGAVAQAIKRLALIRGRTLGEHPKIRDFVRETAHDLGRPDLFRSFLDLEKLHVNFYDRVVDPRDLPDYMVQAEAFIAEIDRLADGETSSGSSP